MPLTGAIGKLRRNASIRGTQKFACDPRYRESEVSRVDCMIIAFIEAFLTTNSWVWLVMAQYDFA